MRVVVADDAMITREGIVHLLRGAGFDVVGQAGDLDGLLRAVALDAPDVVVVDIRMPPTHTDEGLVAARRIRSEHTGVGVLVLSQYVEPAYALQLLEEHPGRVGYLLKERVFDVAILIDALRRIADDETVIDPTIVARLVGRYRKQDPLDKLTQREREVLGLIAEGLSNARYRPSPCGHRKDRSGAHNANFPEAPTPGTPRLPPTGHGCRHISSKPLMAPASEDLGPRRCQDQRQRIADLALMRGRELGHTWNGLLAYHEHRHA